MSNLRPREILLVADTPFLLAASAGGMVADLAAPLPGGPAEPQRSGHLTAGAVHVLLGTSNLVFWPIFIASDMLAWAG